ncbi:MAG: superoxide dismutase [Phycisphaerales bacterium]
MDTALTRRASLGAIAALAGGAIAAPGTLSAHDRSMGLDLAGWDEGAGKFILPKLPYDKAALEPHVDAKTMEIHHGKHHQAYVDGANKALAELRNIREGGGDVNLVKHWSRELSFHLSGHINHTLFWNLLSPPSEGGGGAPKAGLAAAITRDFGSFEKFAAHFKTACLQVEGGGWGWLVVEPFSKRLLILQQEKQQNMLPTWAKPVLGIDVWEHAYYLTYQNRRGDYLSAIMNVVDWAAAEELHTMAQR